jgi:hypothetical protein
MACCHSAIEASRRSDKTQISMDIARSPQFPFGLVAHLGPATI